MNTPEDPIDALLREQNAYVDDNGFTARVIKELPRRRRAWLRPTIMLSDSSGNSVTRASAINGVPSAPNATGAVFPMSASPAAGKGLNPSPINMAAEMATGVPKPAAPSMNAPKLNAIKST